LALCESLPRRLLCAPRAARRAGGPRRGGRRRGGAGGTRWLVLLPARLPSARRPVPSGCPRTRPRADRPCRGSAHKRSTVRCRPGGVCLGWGGVHPPALGGGRAARAAAARAFAVPAGRSWLRSRVPPVLGQLAWSRSLVNGPAVIGC